MRYSVCSASSPTSGTPSLIGDPVEWLWTGRTWIVPNRGRTGAGLNWGLCPQFASGLSGSGFRFGVRPGHRYALMEAGTHQEIVPPLKKQPLIVSDEGRGNDFGMHLK